MMYNYGRFGGWGGTMSFGWIFEILFWGLIIFIIVMLFKRNKTMNRGDEDNSDTAIEILRERYAKGEISKKQLIEMKKDLLEE